MSGVTDKLTLEEVEKYQDIKHPDTHIEINGRMVGADDICDQLADTMRSLAVRDSEVDHLDSEVERLMRENCALRHDIDRHLSIAVDYAQDNERLREALHKLRPENYIEGAD